MTTKDDTNTEPLKPTPYKADYRKELDNQSDEDILNEGREPEQEQEPTEPEEPKVPLAEPEVNWKKRYDDLRTYHNRYVEKNKAELKGAVEPVVAATGAEEVDLVVHSLGGLNSRAYLQDADEKVNKLVQLGTPNHGSQLANMEIFMRENFDYPVLPKTDDPEVRRVLEQLSVDKNDGDGNPNWERTSCGDVPFDESSLTEDYELGLTVAAMGGRTKLVRSRDSRGALVAVRAYFPASLGAAVRQKARWMTAAAAASLDLNRRDAARPAAASPSAVQCASR